MNSTTDDLLEIWQDERMLGWQDPFTGKVVPFVHGGATDDDEDEEDEDEDEDSEDEDESDDDEDSEDEDDEEEEEDDDSLTLSVNEMRRIASKEKRDGRRSGRNQLLKELGVSSPEEAKRKMKQKTSSKPKGEDDDTAEDLKAEQEEKAAKDRETARTMGRVERKLIAAGAPDQDKRLQGIVAMLDLEIDEFTDVDDITTAVEDLKKEMPALFGVKAVKKARPSQKTDSGGRGGRRTKASEGKGSALLAQRHPATAAKK